MKETNLFRPYKINEIADLEREMKAVTFERLLANNEDCPEGLLPTGVADSKAYMRKYIDDKRADDLIKASKPQKQFYTSPDEFYRRESSIQIEEIFDQPNESTQETPELEAIQTPQLEGLADKLVYYDQAEDSTETLSTQASEERISKPVRTNLIPYDDEVDLEPESEQQDNVTEFTDLEALD